MITTSANTGAKKAPLITTNPLTTANIIGTRIYGLYGRRSLGSRNLRTIAPRTVRKKKEYSPSPLNVKRARKFPRRMYRAERIVESKIALMGASDRAVLGNICSSSVLGFNPMYPTEAKIRGNQFMFAAATAMRPATNELPRREPATTRQIRAAAAMPNPCPRIRVIAVYSTI